MRGPDYDDALDRAMHDTFDPEQQAEADEQASTEAGYTFPLYSTPAAAQAANARPERSWSRGTPVRNLRLDDTRWAAVQAQAERTGNTASDIIRTALDHYLDQPEGVPLSVEDRALITEALNIAQESVDDYADQFSTVDARLDEGKTRADAAKMRALAARIAPDQNGHDA